MISAHNFVNTVMIPYREHGGYIYGASGAVHTQSAQNAATRDTTIKYGQQWVGKRCWDCSGLIYWALKLYGISIYHGSDTQYRHHCAVKGKLTSGSREDGKPLKVGSVVFLYDKEKKNRHHVGVFIGGSDGQTVVEAKGTAYGVVTSKLSHWDEWGELKDVNYSEEVYIEQDGDVIRPGMKSDAVKALQAVLNSDHACNLEVDGVFGVKTKAALETVQALFGLVPDGICGVETFNALFGSDADEDSEDDIEYEETPEDEDVEDAVDMDTVGANDEDITDSLASCVVMIPCGFETAQEIVDKNGGVVYRRIGTERE